MSLRLAELGAHVVVCDVDAEGAARAFEADILVNNAGIQHVAPLERFEPERFAFMPRLMLEAPFLLTRASAYKSAYVSAKHGLLGLSKVIALEGAVTGTEVVLDGGWSAS